VDLYYYPSLVSHLTSVFWLWLFSAFIKRNWQRHKQNYLLFDKTGIIAETGALTSYGVALTLSTRQINLDSSSHSLSLSFALFKLPTSISRN